MSYKDNSLEFSKRIDGDEAVILEYNIIRDEPIDLSPKYFRLIDEAPPYAGCSFCIHKEEMDDVFFRCKLKDKTMSKDIKNCKLFRQEKVFRS